jgi:hypothetical protein
VELSGDGKTEKEEEKRWLACPYKGVFDLAGVLEGARG